MSTMPTTTEELRDKYAIMSNMWLLAQLRQPGRLGPHPQTWKEILTELLSTRNVRLEREIVGNSLLNARVYEVAKYTRRLRKQLANHSVEERISEKICERIVDVRVPRIVEQVIEVSRSQVEDESWRVQLDRFSMFLCRRWRNSWWNCRRPCPRTESSNGLWSRSSILQFDRFSKTSRFSPRTGFNSVLWKRRSRSHSWRPLRKLMRPQRSRWSRGKRIRYSSRVHLLVWRHRHISQDPG